ncbi:nickel ABC transporter, membrane protein NikQ [Citrifermentans bemidjiense Bem]|uniref:Nickel ABC transporter, membrane protein NikQ n=1 Tax=Citrifermentans bemidjiense (strain ATCC BAA-1014 / DSM 16622 / JCM 12645 / Bem) TaxID=404380 RepID=B5EE91_CITBB|nr:cobalt ECF transporter T component CbiQ [Citrifermentans bemidjiense]ACH39236.1 nickel ABC transporter, membrane protein NikQ [Citrifermentans bemidjiense Bem]
MASISAALLDLKRLDQLASGTTFLHRLDARAKVLATLVFIVCVVSFDRYQISPLIPFLIFPAFLIAVGELPTRYLLGKVALVAPFAIAVGICNPYFDRQVLLQLGALQVTGGWLSFASIVLRTGLTVGAVFALTALTGFPAICRALQRLGMPRPFALQLMFLYRYLFVLAEEGRRAAKARELRCLGRKGSGLKSYASLLGHLLLRTWQRAERMHMAMLARGFSGTFPEQVKARLRFADVVFLSIWVSLCIVLRLTNVTHSVGSFFTGLLP